MLDMYSIVRDLRQLCRECGGAHIKIRLTHENAVEKCQIEVAYPLDGVSAGCHFVANEANLPSINEVVHAIQLQRDKELAIRINLTETN